MIGLKALRLGAVDVAKITNLETFEYLEYVELHCNKISKIEGFQKNLNIQFLAL